LDWWDEWGKGGRGPGLLFPACQAFMAYVAGRISRRTGVKGNPLASYAPLDLDQLVVGTHHSNQAYPHRRDLLRSFIRLSSLFLCLR